MAAIRIRKRIFTYIDEQDGSPETGILYTGSPKTGILYTIFDDEDTIPSITHSTNPPYLLERLSSSDLLEIASFKEKEEPGFFEKMLGKLFSPKEKKDSSIEESDTKEVKENISKKNLITVTVDSIPGAGKSIVSYFIYDLLKQKGLDVVEYNSIDFPTIESLEEFGARKDSQEMTEFLNKNVKIKLIDKYTNRR